MSDIREALEAAFSSAESGEAPGEAPAQTVEVAEAPSATEPAVAAEPQQDGRTRDDKGRFAPKSATPAPKPAESAATPAPQQAAPTPTEAPKPATTTPSAPELRAPQSWKPEIREKWNVLPDEVKREIIRREKEASTALQETAEPRKFHQQFQQAIDPYRAMLQAEGADPIRAVSNLMQTAYALRTAPPAQKAQLVAQIVKGYGVPIDALDAALAGESVPQQTQAHPAAPPDYRDPRLDALIQRAQHQQQQQMLQTFNSFVQEQPEFFEDVRDLMADIVDLEAKRNPQVAPDLKSAYSRACLLHPEVSKVLEQRKAAQAAATATAATQQARAAASSVRSQPATSVPGDKPKDLRSTIEAAWETASGR